MKKKIDFDYNLLDALNLIKLSWDAVCEKTVANCFRRWFASDTTNEDTDVKEDQQCVKKLFDRLRSFVKLLEDVTFECFVEANKDLSTTSEVSKGEIFEIFKPSNKNEVRNYMAQIWLGHPNKQRSNAGIKHNSLFYTNS
ncbi:hypothetical protein HZS_5318 [Henneguya salminicola]|nr:hypothetical protein HZS_5318 [Henneguya salminicola]